MKEVIGINIIQVPLSVPIEIAEGIEKGDYELVGGVVRTVDTKQVVTWLKDADIADAKDKALNVIKKNKVIVGMFGALSLAAIGGVAYVRKEKKNKELEKESLIEEFDRSFDIYMEQARKGQLSEKTVDNFKESLNELNTVISEKNIDFDEKFIDKLNILVDLIYTYTVNFAAANNYDTQIQKNEDNKLKSNLIFLEDYLEIQGNIFKNVK